MINEEPISNFVVVVDSDGDPWSALGWRSKDPPPKISMPTGCRQIAVSEKDHDTLIKDLRAYRLVDGVFTLKPEYQ